MTNDSNSITVAGIRTLLEGLDDDDLLIFRTIPGTFHIARRDVEGEKTSSTTFSINSKGILDLRAGRIIPPEEIDEDASLLT